MEERQSDQTDWSANVAQLEEVSGDEGEQQTRRQLLIPLVFEFYGHANRVEPITTVAVVPAHETDPHSSWTRSFVSWTGLLFAVVSCWGGGGQLLRRTYASRGACVSLSLSGTLGLSVVVAL